jgi:hypothetical protein
MTWRDEMGEVTRNASARCARCYVCGRPASAVDYSRPPSPASVGVAIIGTRHAAWLSHL